MTDKKNIEDGDLVLVERGLLGAACAIIREAKPESNTLKKLRAITFAPRTQSAPVLDDERAAFETAMRETYQMVDPFNPPPAGTYARGAHEGIIAALKTMRENFARAASPQATATLTDEWRSAVATAYGYLWHIANPEPLAPDHVRIDLHRASYRARAALRDLMTHEQRGEAINAVRAILTSGGEHD